MRHRPRLAVLGNVACVAALGGVCAFWVAHAQNATDDARFTGVARALETEGWRVSRRSFEPGARTAWHAHPEGQLLLVESGRGRIRERGGALRELAAGESHYTPPAVEHWHGATPDTELVQVALTRGDPTATVWLEKVDDEQYSGR